MNTILGEHLIFRNRWSPALRGNVFQELAKKFFSEFLNTLLRNPKVPVPMSDLGLRSSQLAWAMLTDVQVLF